MTLTKTTKGSIYILLIAVTASVCGRSHAQDLPPGKSGAAAIVDEPNHGEPNPRLRANRYPRYELRPNDVLDITFEFTPELNESVTIQPDGYIALRGAGELHVAGETVAEAKALLTKAYSNTLTNPSIDVTLKQFEKPYFTAGGAVTRPGKYDLSGDTTVLEGVLMAGGFTDSAKHSQVLLFRRVSRDWMEAKVLNLKKMISNKNVAEDLHLVPGDMIFVPESRVSKIRRFVPVPGVGVGVNPGLP